MTSRSGPRLQTLRLWAAGAAAWTAPYVASKIYYALDGRLGVTGGPQVTASNYAGYRPGEVAAAQWANAGLGAAILLLFAACTLPVAVRAPRWLAAPPVAGVAVMGAAGAVGMIGQAVATDAGGAVFGAYCAVWAAAASGVLRELLRGAQLRRTGRRSS